jgi:predicted MFS family arabinose efflux permease
MAAAIPLVSESADPETGKTDYIGYVLGPLALGLVVFGIIRGETLGYTSWRVLTLLAAGVAALVLFVVAELHAKAPMLEIKYFRRPPFSGSLTVAFATYFGVFSIFFLTAIYLQVVAGYSPLKLAVLFIPMAGCMIVSSSVAGKWVAVQGAQAPVTLGCLAAGAGVLLTDLALKGGTHFISLVLTLALAGIGFGVAVVPITTVALSALPAKHSGMAASATTTTREVGTVVGVAALGSLFSNRLSTFLTQRLTDLKFPTALSQQVQDAVLLGKIPSGFDLYQPVIDNPHMNPAQVAALYPDPAQYQIADGIVQATNAAFDAVGNGVSWALLVSGCVILAAAVVAYFTFPRTA